MKASTRIDATYDGIKNVSITRNMIKKYLYGHVRSSFLRVDFDEANNGSTCCLYNNLEKDNHSYNGYFKRRKKNWYCYDIRIG